METLKEKYNKIMEQRRAIITEMKTLEENEILKRYFDLKEQNEILSNDQFSLFRNMKMEEYATCNHILVYSKIDYDRYEGRSYESCGCIKCGLDNSVLNETRDCLSGTQKIMYDYLKKNYLSSNFGGIQTEILCDIDLAQAIYTKIKNVYPDISDEKAINFFKYALKNIRDVKVSDERKVNRAKRLELDSDFKKWDSSDISNS